MPLPQTVLHSFFPFQANPPKFMYAKSEIMRRREAVGINVRAQLLLRLHLG